ncbi:putative stf2-like protein [Botrytis cinerea BcDW1]|uniref:Putative stf2-like protein n=1 Tax=Botryotinia fuckeliana (strain BcDW1) TaxID=1290391 RepID=M7U2H0_BOTF1|nr:putative stf2-like protein [Botrytis cinerea BcDW1]
MFGVRAHQGKRRRESKEAENTQPSRGEGVEQRAALEYAVSSENGINMPTYLPGPPQRTPHNPLKLGKSHKYNDRDHAGLADGTALPQEHLPRYFAKSGHIDADPKKAKKNGAGKGGWGVNGEEVQDEGFNMANARRRSNSSSYTAGLKDFKTKFEQIETEPVFEENIHGALMEELPETTRSNTNSSESSSVDEDVKTK